MTMGLDSEDSTRGGASQGFLLLLVGVTSTVILVLSAVGSAEVSRASSVLYVIPIVLVAIEFGLIAGLAAACGGAAALLGSLAFGLLSSTGPEAVTARLVVFFATAAFAGAIADAIREQTARLWELNALLDALANRDDLTGLANRRAFRSELRRHIEQARSPGRLGAVLAIDVDRLKTVNDHLGHDAGDELLVDVANKLRLNLGPEAMIARLGGDEFAVLLPGTDRRAATETAACLTFDLTGTNIVSEESVAQVGTASIGVAPIEPPVTVDRLMREADSALYEAKRLGGGCIAIIHGGEPSR